MHAQPPAPRKAACSAQAGQRPAHRAHRFGVDPDTCTGDHSCIRLSGCPSLTVKPNPDPLRSRPGGPGDRRLRGLRPVRRGGARGRAVPVVLPRADRHNPTRWDRLLHRLRRFVIGWLQQRRATQRALTAF
jgi:indolepyruvate ferredoxin oxidoreductase alpha subunit